VNGRGQSVGAGISERLLDVRVTHGRTFDGEEDVVLRQIRSAQFCHHVFDAHARHFQHACHTWHQIRKCVGIDFVAASHAHSFQRAVNGSSSAGRLALWSSGRVTYMPSHSGTSSGSPSHASYMRCACLRLLPSVRCCASRSRLSVNGSGTLFLVWRGGSPWHIVCTLQRPCQADCGKTKGPHPARCSPL